MLHLAERPIAIGAPGPAHLIGGGGRLPSKRRALVSPSRGRGAPGRGGSN